MVYLKFIKTRVKILAKALGDLIVRHQCHTTLVCRSLDVRVPVKCLKEYEFSCSSSPAAPPASHVTRSKRSRYNQRLFLHHHHHHNQPHRPRRVSHALPVRTAMLYLKSPLGREVGLNDPIKLRPLMNSDDGDYDLDLGGCVDRAAEDFIQRFYKELRLQKLNFPL